MDTTTILIIVLVLLLLGGGWYGRGAGTNRPASEQASPTPCPSSAREPGA